jgi:hypothetical protein
VDPPHVETFALADGTDVSIDFTYRTDRTTVGRLGVTESIYVTFRPKHRTGINETIRPVSHLRDLLIISCGQALMPVSIRLFCPTRLAAPDTADDPDQRPIRFYRATVHPDVETSEESGRLDFMVTAPQHPKGVAGAIEGWFALYEYHSAAISIVSGLHYAPQVLRDPELLLALIVAEAYHRASSFPQVVRREDMKRWHALIAVTPPEHVEWLEDFVAQLEEPSLNRRLKDLIRRVGDVGKALTANVPKYSFRASTWRNAFVHSQDEGDAKLSGAHLLQLAWITRLLIELALLSDAGFKISGSGSILSHPRFRFASSLQLNWPAVTASGKRKP